MVVAGALFVPGGQPSGLDATQDALVHEHGEGVVHRLARHRSYLVAHRVDHTSGGPVGPFGHRPQHGEALGGDVQPVSSEHLGVARNGRIGHPAMVCLLLDLVKK